MDIIFFEPTLFTCDSSFLVAEALSKLEHFITQFDKNLNKKHEAFFLTKFTKFSRKEIDRISINKSEKELTDSMLYAWLVTIDNKQIVIPTGVINFFIKNEAPAELLAPFLRWFLSHNLDNFFSLLKTNAATILLVLCPLLFSKKNKRMVIIADSSGWRIVSCIPLRTKGDFCFKLYKAVLFSLSSSESKDKIYFLLFNFMKFLEEK